MEQSKHHRVGVNAGEAFPSERALPLSRATTPGRKRTNQKLLDVIQRHEQWLAMLEEEVRKGSRAAVRLRFGASGTV
ncbi:MAG: hypothetical protein H0X01_01450 [Nitrospira sp.]|nr:hypothetical protein [Nitrospira sp.]